MKLTKKQKERYHKILDNILKEYIKIDDDFGIQELTFRSTCTDDDDITKIIEIHAVMTPIEKDIMTEYIFGKKKIYLGKKKLKEENIEMDENRFDGLRDQTKEIPNG